jgi:predicted amidophosphoribosyltransferase
MFEDFLSVFFPERCRGCNISGTALCFNCYKTIGSAAVITEPRNSFALFDYQHPIVQKAVWELKYHRKSPLAKTLVQYGAPLIMEYIASLLQSTTPVIVVLVPIPQHYTKTNSRGFNQSQLLSKWIKAALPTATLQPLLQKSYATAPQARTHTRQQRQQNLAHSMQVTTIATSIINSQTLYVIIDDVITTGSTITEASRALRAAGAKNICAIALAHGYARKQ